MGCSEGNVVLDNASDEKRTLVLDGTTYELGANSSQIIELATGSHTLSIQDAEGESVQEGEFESQAGGIVNVGEHSYIIWKQFYGQDPQLREKYLNEGELEVDGMTFQGDFNVLDSTQLYIEQDWDYGLEENFPQKRFKLPVTTDEQKYVTKKKVVRKKDFLEAYKALVMTPEE